MADVFLALMRSLISLARRRFWVLILLPAMLSLLLLLALAVWVREPLATWLLESHPLGFLVSQGLSWIAQILVFIVSWMTILAAAYFTTALLAAILVMPWLLGHVAECDYPDVAALGADNFSAAAANSVIATLFFVFFWLVSVPFLLIPGVAFVLPVLLLTWYNRRTFAYDALSLHATEGEWKRIRHESRRGFFLIGLLMAILSYVPLFGLLVPTFAALMFIHYGLEMLRRLRGGALVVGEARVVIEDVFSEER